MSEEEGRGVQARLSDAAPAAWKPIDNQTDTFTRLLIAPEKGETGIVDAGHAGGRASRSAPVAGGPFGMSKNVHGVSSVRNQPVSVA